jgi:hypothetical protein
MRRINQVSLRRPPLLRNSLRQAIRRFGGRIREQQPEYPSSPRYSAVCAGKVTIPHSKYGQNFHGRKGDKEMETVRFRSSGSHRLIAAEPVAGVFFDGDSHQLAARSYAGLVKQLLNDSLNGAFRNF